MPTDRVSGVRYWVESQIEGWQVDIVFFGPGAECSTGHELEEALAEHLQRLDDGEIVDRDGFITQYPDLADSLLAYIADSDAVADVLTVSCNGQQVQDTPPAPPEDGGYFADLQLLGELGRGGMRGHWLPGACQMKWGCEQFVDQGSEFPGMERHGTDLRRTAARELPPQARERVAPARERSPQSRN